MQGVWPYPTACHLVGSRAIQLAPAPLGRPIYGLANYIIALFTHPLILAHETIFEVRVAIDDKGECVLVVDGEPRSPWQVMYRALDRLLFSSEDDA